MNDKLNSSRGILLESGTNEVEFLQFSIGNQRYGINVAKVRQILSYSDGLLTEIPGEKRGVCGIIYFRDKPCPVLDLRVCLKIAGEPANPARRLLIMTEFNQHVAGMIIDDVTGIMRISWEEFKPVESDFFGGTDVNIVGTVKDGDNIVLVLDVESLLSSLVPSASMESRLDQISSGAGLKRDTARILYCEDSTIVQKLLVGSLMKAGFQHIKVCPTGADGLECIKTGGEKFDLILTDIEMPRMDGLTLCRELRELPQTKATPVIFFSSMITDEMKRKCASVGGSAAYSKPEIHLIVDEIDKILSLR